MREEGDRPPFKKTHLEKNSPISRVQDKGEISACVRGRDGNSKKKTKKKSKKRQKARESEEKTQKVTKTQQKGAKTKNKPKAAKNKVVKPG